MKKSLLILLFFIANSLLGIEPVILTEDKSEYPIGLHLEILEDKESKLTIEDIQKPEMEKLWVKSKSEIPNFALSDSAYWLRFKLQSTNKKSKNWLLEIFFPLIDYIDFYIMEEDGKYSITQTGDRRPFGTRQYEHRNFLFNISIDAQKTKTVYIKTWSHDGLHESIPIVLLDKDTFLKKSSKIDTVMGAYLGIIFVMMLYNLFIYLSVKDIAYLYYILYLFGFICWVLCYYGYAFQYFWPESPWWANHCVLLFVIFFGMMGILFSRAFLATSRFTPRIDIFLKFIIILHCIYLPLNFILSYSMIWKLFIFTESIAIIMVLTADVLCLKKGYRPAGYYLIAWTFLLSGGMLLILKGVSVVPSNFITENSMSIGSAMEVILLSLGLADRINELKRQNELTRIKNQEELQKLNDELEQKVMERTTQVNEMLDQVGKLYLDSENKRMEIENLAESRKKLSLVGQMAAGIVHDIKNPMATIKSLAEMLNSDSISQQRKTKNLNLIVREMDRLSDLSYEILDFSKGHLNLNLKEVNLKEFIYEIEQFLKIDFDYANVKCILDIQYGESISIDRDRMRRVFINIAKNAIEAMYDGQKDYSLTIRSEKQDDRVMLYFIDNGNGLPKSVEERLFEAFTTEGKTKGTGLGLYMCKWIVESHNGELTYKTKSGEGTTFFISLPIE